MHVGMVGEEGDGVNGMDRSVDRSIGRPRISAYIIELFLMLTFTIPATPALQSFFLFRFYRERLAECSEILRRSKLPPAAAGVQGSE
jgi:hypothetical protein